MKRFILTLTVALGATAFGPRPVAAEDAECTRGFVQCLNDTYDLEGFLQTLADIECSAQYAGCLAKSMIQG